MSDPAADQKPPKSFLRSIPLFPLPNVVLFPRAILPLHIFEDRYKLMTADALRGDKQIAMALLKPGWEKNYYGLAEIETVVCVGTILSSEQLPNGTYNFLLQGQSRANIADELPAIPGGYRQANLELLIDSPASDNDLEIQRLTFTSLFNARPLSELPIAGQFRQMLSGTMPVTELADLIAFTFLENVSDKQSLLADANVSRRVSRTIELVTALQAKLVAAARAQNFDPRLN